jgi:hypothetical protein
MVRVDKYQFWLVLNSWKYSPLQSILHEKCAITVHLQYLMKAVYGIYFWFLSTIFGRVKAEKIDSWNWVGTKYGIFTNIYPRPHSTLSNVLEELGYKWQ